MLRGVREKLTPAVVAMGSAYDLGTPGADFTAYGAGDGAFTATLAELIAGQNEEILAAYVDGDEALPYRRRRGIDRLLAGRTGVLIAHRLSSLSRVDKIAVIDRGEVVEYGRREDLVADPRGRFARMLEVAGERR